MTHEEREAAFGGVASLFNEEEQVMDVQEIISHLTLEQKCALLSGAETFKTRGYSQLGIPQMWLADGPNGVRKQAGESDHLGLNPSVAATCFPTASAAASSWNPELGEKIGAALGEEAAAQDVAVLLGPGLNIKRSPLCGRNFEYFSEDPFLSGKMAAAYIRGIQSHGISACPKHFAVNSQELRRMATDSVVDERTLREIYLTGFEIALREGKPRTIMTSYNLVNGAYANENEHLLMDILRGEWGFDGVVVTDWGGSNDHALGVKMGSTLEMPAPGGDSIRELMRAIENGDLSEAELDDRLEELLSLVRDTRTALERAPKTFDVDAHHALCRQAAAECGVLLKNEDGLLPLKAGRSVALIGDFADTPRYQGAGSSCVNVTRLDRLRDTLSDAGVKIVGYAPGFDRQGKADEEKKVNAELLAKQADVVVMCLGLDELRESEGIDRRNMCLAWNQVDLLKSVADVNRNIVVVLFCGSAVETPWVGNCKALLWAALGGQAGAGAVADLLTGRCNPSGKLAETWPLRCEDMPARDYFDTPGRTVEYREGPFVGYRYYQTAQVPVAFPFGFGLSYTTFSYRDLKVTPAEASLVVKNTGAAAGAEIVQLYVEKTDSRLIGPTRQLKGFAKVFLQPGEAKNVSIPLDGLTFRYWNTATNSWEVEGGIYELKAGASCEDIRLTTTLEIAAPSAAVPDERTQLPVYASAQIHHVPDQEFERLLGRPIPSRKIRIDRNTTFGELNHARSPMAWIIWGVLTFLLNSSLKRGKPDLNIFFIYNMPLRALAKMTGGMVSMGMVDALVMEFRGFWIIGILRLICAFIKNITLNAGLEKRLGRTK